MHDLLEYVTGRCLACEGRSRKVDCHGRAGKSIVHVASSERSEGDPENGSRSDSDSAVLDGADRRSRFDLREGHDLERLFWPGTGSGDSTGLLQNLAVDGRRSPTVEPI